MKLDRKLFRDPSRKSLENFLNDKISNIHSHLTNGSVLSDADEQSAHKAAMTSGTLSVLLMIKYLCTDNKQVKPWIVRKSSTTKLDFKQFTEYSEQVVQRLTRQPPSVNYGALVHIQSIISILTTMEYTNA